MRCLILAFSLILLGACAAKEPQPRPVIDCPAMYVILPDNFIIDLAADSTVLLDPAVQEFAVFCSPQKAQAALKEASLPGAWRIYHLKGEASELTRPHESGGLVLDKPGEVDDWVEI